MRLPLFTLLHPAWFYTGFLPGAVSLVIVAVKSNKEKKFNSKLNVR